MKVEVDRRPGPGDGESHRAKSDDDSLSMVQGAQPAWEMLAPYISREQGELIRFATYEFRSLLAETMQEGRAFLAGDSAHLMPPFMAEGMCSGLRDANNLSWKLDQVLRQLAPPQLLDTYTSERRAQNEFTVQISLMMGQVACILDRDAAAGRDAAFRSGQTPPPPPVPGLGDGVLHHDLGGEPAAPAGSLAVQGRVRIDGRAGLYDDVVGAGFAVVLPPATLEESSTRRSWPSSSKSTRQWSCLTRTSPVPLRIWMDSSRGGCGGMVSPPLSVAQTSTRSGVSRPSATFQRSSMNSRPTGIDPNARASAADANARWLRSRIDDLS